MAYQNIRRQIQEMNSLHSSRCEHLRSNVNKNVNVYAIFISQEYRTNYTPEMFIHVYRNIKRRIYECYAVLAARSHALSIWFP